jgi:hypothetical protein
MLPNTATTSMPDEPIGASKEPVKQRLARLLIVLAGIVLGQVILYGPSLTSRKILLPLDILAQPEVYLPLTPERAKMSPHNTTLVDLVVYAEPSRRYLGAELRSGRFPLWNLYQYAGAPDILPKFSPFVLLGAAFASPGVLPWIELLKALTGALGFYFFCRRVLRVAFWPATIAAWCYPLTAFFVLWQGFGTAAPVLWLPWLLLAVDQTVRRASPLAPVGLSAVTGLVLTSGQLDVGGQVLLASGLYAVWCVIDAYRKEWLQPNARKAALSLTMGWALGFTLAAPYILPVLAYSQTGARMAQRSAGLEERPPVGLAALPQVVLPKIYGSPERGSVPSFPKGQDHLVESSAAAYAGLLATLFVAPLASCSRRHRSLNLFWIGLGFFALSWCLNVPLLVNLLRLPGLNMMSHNRFVFATAFAILALAAVGLDALWCGQVQWRRWFWLPTAVSAGLCGWCVVRALSLPQAIGNKIAAQVIQGQNVGWVHDLQGVRQVQQWYVCAYATEAVLCALCLAAWLYLWVRKTPRPWLLALSGCLLVMDLLWFGFGRAAQCDPALYYPPIPALEAIAKSAPGRMIGYGCLPAALAEICGLRDIRGYDAVDPTRLMDLMAIGCDPRATVVRYALTQWLAPSAKLRPEGGIRLSPVLDMLGVRYVVFRDAPPPTARPAFQGPDYWVMVNSNALPRAFIPQRIEMVTKEQPRLRKLASPQFDPRAVAYVESPVDLPGPCRGTASIVEEIPTRIRVAVQMETPGLVVLADLWDKGWQAHMDGRRLPILRANHAIRGVIVSAGSGVLEFRYAPTSFAWGLKLAALAALAWLIWLGVALRSRETEA